MSTNEPIDIEVSAIEVAPQPIDELIHQLYTRYKLVRNSTGYYYEIDDTYQGSATFTGPNNVSYTYNPTQNSVSSPF